MVHTVQKQLCIIPMVLRMYVANGFNDQTNPITLKNI